MKRILLASLTLLLVFACGEKQSSSKSIINETEQNEPAFTKEAELLIIHAGDTLEKLDIELAEKDYEITQGLMFRRKMAQNQGMLFLFTSLEERTFWMKNTYIPLDIIFLDQEMNIVSIKESNPPFSERGISSDTPAQYVLEVNGGYCSQKNISVGMKAVLIK